MFKQGKSNEIEVEIPPSVIGADLRIVGAIVTKGHVQVDGIVDGDIQCGVLVVGANGAVNGDVVAEVVRLEGGITGTVNANAVHLIHTAHMHGDVHHAKLTVEAGAIVDGNYRQRDAVEATIETRLGAAASPSTLGGDNKIASGSVVLQGPHAPA